MGPLRQSVNRELVFTYPCVESYVDVRTAVVPYAAQAPCTCRSQENHSVESARAKAHLPSDINEVDYVAVTIQNEIPCPTPPSLLLLREEY